MRLLYVILLLVASITAAGTVQAQQRPGEVQDITLTEKEANALAPTRAWTQDESSILNDARARALNITSDSQFREIVLAAADANEISWPRDTMKNLPREARRSPTRWVLNRLTQVGHFPISEIQVGGWVFDPPRRAKRAGTLVCLLRRQPCTTFRTWFHPDIVRRDSLIPLVNTFVHERIHAIGQEHVSQERRRNRCEAPSIIGDIAESLLERRALGQPIRPRQRLCPSLNTRLQALDIVRRPRRPGTP